MRMEIIPKFNAKEIITITIEKDWFEYQLKAFMLGNRILSFMQSYINANRKRKGGTGRLSKAMTIEHTDIPGGIFWGIGNIGSLNASVPYWYVINYGKKITGQPFIPGGGKLIPGSFEGSRPNSALRGGGSQRFNYKDGSGFGMKPKSAVRPMNFIQAATHRLDGEMLRLLAKLRKG